MYWSRTSTRPCFLQGARDWKTTCRCSALSDDNLLRIGESNTRAAHYPRETIVPCVCDETWNMHEYIYLWKSEKEGTPLKWEVVASFIALEHDTLTIAHNFLLNGMKWIARCIRYKHCVHSLYTNVLYIICKHKNIDGRLSIKLSNKKARGKVKKKK